MSDPYEIDEAPLRAPRPRLRPEARDGAVPARVRPVDGKPRKRRKKKRPPRPSLRKRLGAAIAERVRAGRERMIPAFEAARRRIASARALLPEKRPRFDRETLEDVRRRGKELLAICVGTRPHQDTTTLQAMRQQFMVGLALCGFVVIGLGGWAATAELSGAVIASATVVVESELKRIQHPTGGIVGQINVHDGELVQAGQVLLRLDETTTQANLSIVTKQLDELTGRRARLESERDGVDRVTFPPAFEKRGESDPTIAMISKGERALFQARRAARAGQAAQLSERIAQLRQEIEGLDAQKAAKEEQSRLTENELKTAEELHRKNLTPTSRLLDVQRSAARLRGESGQIVASIAEAKGKIAETELQIIQIEQTQRTEVLNELREIESRMGELIERKISGEDQLKRIEVRAPQSGYVHQLAVHTVGGVISAGDTLMYIVPRADDLAIDAKTEPKDIDQIAVGQPAVVRLPAFNQRTTPELNGKVVRVAANVSRDEIKGTVHYLVRVALNPGELKRLGDQKLVPGMPAEVHIRTGDRTALSYLLKPLSDQFNRAFREE